MLCNDEWLFVLAGGALCDADPQLELILPVSGCPSGMSCIKILHLSTVSHRSEYTPHIFLNILLYIFI